MIWPDGILAPLLAVALFLLWSAVGYAALSALNTGLERGRQLLVAPAVGAAFCVLTIFWLNWSGLPVRAFAWPLLAAVVVIATAALWIRHPHVSRADVGHAALPLAAALLLNGWPLLTNGFAWLAYTNDDMATYCLMAARVMDHGLVEAPSAAMLRAGSDLAGNMWLFDVTFGRAGTHLVLAWVASLVPRSVIELYMPVLLAMHMALVAAAGALVWRTPAQRSAALATCWLLAVSALTALGTVSQLLPQVFGLTLACAFLALAWDIDRPPLGIGRVVAAAVTGASFLIVYTEFAPFVAIPWLVRLLVLRLWRRDRRQALWTVGAIALTGLVCAAPYADRVLPFLVQQATGGVRSSVNGVDLFPYFRLSPAFANLWGLLPIARNVPEPWLSIAIVAGALAFAVTFPVLIGPLRRGDSAPAVLLFLLLFAVFLFERGSGFGLFKIAMYVQPFMLGTVALVLAPAIGPDRARWRWAALASIAAIGLPTQAFYVRSSVDPALNRTQIQDQPGAMHDLLALGDVRGGSVDVDLPVVPIAKFAALSLGGVPQRFIGLRDTFRPRADPSKVSKRLRPDVSALSAIVLNAAGAPREFALRDPAQPSKSDRFYLVPRPSPDDVGAPACDRLVTTAAVESVINRTTTGAAGGSLRVVSCRDLTNHLAFVSSELGRNYYFGGTDPVAMHSLERDYFYPDRTFAGVGRYLLFEVLQPVPASRLVLDFTSTLKGDGSNLLPPAAVVGGERTPLPIVGRGAARVYSKPLAPQWIDGHAYVAVDFGIDGTRFPDARRGLMRWLGRDLELDPRRLVGFARNISLVSDAEYQKLVPPAQIARFPDDLRSPALEYSGLYEDGWVADDLVAVLTRPSGPAMVTVKGTLLPAASGAGMTITIEIDGVAAASGRRNPGAFAMEAPIPAGKAGRIVVEIKFSAVRPLAAPDRRPASAHLDYLGVTPVSN